MQKKNCTPLSRLLKLLFSNSSFQGPNRAVPRRGVADSRGHVLPLQVRYATEHDLGVYQRRGCADAVQAAGGGLPHHQWNRVQCW